MVGEGQQDLPGLGKLRAVPRAQGSPGGPAKLPSENEDLQRGLWQGGGFRWPMNWNLLVRCPRLN